MSLTAPERMELERRVARRRGRADEARRARCILLVTNGVSSAEIRRQLDCSDSYIARWTGRFATERLAGLYSRHRGQPVTKLTLSLEARILEATRRGPGGGTTQWSTRRLGKHLGLSHMMVARAWAKHGLRFRSVRSRSRSEKGPGPPPPGRQEQLPGRGLRRGPLAPAAPVV
jgi:transposase